MCTVDCFVSSATWLASLPNRIEDWVYARTKLSVFLIGTVIGIGSLVIPMAIMVSHFYQNLLPPLYDGECKKTLVVNSTE